MNTIQSAHDTLPGDGFGQSTPSSPTCQTRLHRYDFRLTDPEQSKAWKALQKKLEGRKCLEMWGDVNGPKSLPDGASETVEDVTIELKHIFNDQWNTTTDRVFDWYKFYEVRGQKRARGHFGLRDPMTAHVCMITTFIVATSHTGQTGKANRVTKPSPGTTRSQSNCRAYCRQWRKLNAE